MKKKTPPYAIIGAVVFGFIAIMVYMHMRSAEQQAEADREAKLKADMQAQIDAANAKQAPVVKESDTRTRPVLYATQPVEAGQRISPAFYEKKPTPNDILPDAYTDQSDIVGFYAIRKIEKGDPLSPRNIGKSLPYMSQRIPPGMRAVALPVFNAEDNNTGGFVVDGDKVDLLFTYSPTINGEQMEVNTQTVMQNLTVLFVPGPTIRTDQTDGIVPATPPGEPISVTFEVTPEQAEALVFLSQAKDAKFSMILRSRRDDSEIKVKPFDIRDYDPLNLSRLQKTIDKSENRVNQLAKEIEAKEQALAPAPGTTKNETTPTPTPSP